MSKFNLKSRLVEIPRRIKNIFYKNTHNIMSYKYDIETELEKITRQLIEETIGEKGLLTIEFQKKLEIINSDKHPINEAVAKEILLGLLGLAISQRSILTERISKSIENGNIYREYLSQLEEIDRLNVRAELLNKNMERIQTDYEKQLLLYERVSAKTYLRDVWPTDEDVERLKNKEGM